MQVKPHLCGKEKGERCKDYSDIFGRADINNEAKQKKESPRSNAVPRGNTENGGTAQKPDPIPHVAKWGRGVKWNRGMQQLLNEECHELFLYAKKRKTGFRRGRSYRTINKKRSGSKE